MKTKRNSNLRQNHGCYLFVGLMVFLLSVKTISANDAAISHLEFTGLAGDSVQIRLDLTNLPEPPKIFQTDNPARIAIDFAGVKSQLDKKSFPINQGAASTIYVVEAQDRTRVVINLTENVPYHAHSEGNQFFIDLKPGPLEGGKPTAEAGVMPPLEVAATPPVPNVPPAPSVAMPVSPPVAAAMPTPSPDMTPKAKPTNLQAVKASGAKKTLNETLASKFLPPQSIKSIDFRRGPKGEGRLVLGLTAANTVVDSKEKGDKVVLNFVNTHLPAELTKNFDVSDFATPVRMIEASPKGGGTSIVVTTNDGNYEYSSYQSDTVLTVEFRPLTRSEKEALQREKFPYTGNKLSLNFQDIEVRSVLQILADFTELNIIAADSVAGSVTLRLNDVPWDQALDLILKSKGLGKREMGNVMMVAPNAEIMKIEQEELESKRVVQELEPLKTENIYIKYAKAEDIHKLILGIRSETETIRTESASGAVNMPGYNREVTQETENDTGFALLSPRGSAFVDPRTNVLIVNDTVKQLEALRKVIAELDVPVRQVLIEARIVIADTTFARDLGVKFGATNNRITQSNDDDGSERALETMGYAMQALAGPSGLLGMTLASGANYLLSLEIDALQNEGRGELLSNPRVMTSDRQEATIKQGVQIPYAAGVLTGNTYAVTVKMIDAVLQLKVKPQITPDGSVIMDIDVKKDSPGTEITTGGLVSVPIDKRQVQTRVQVDDGQTVVLGGVFEANYSTTSSFVPWLGELPVVGWLFTPTKAKKEEKKELLIFVTPKVIKGSVKAD